MEEFPEVNENKFRVQNQRLLLTYPRTSIQDVKSKKHLTKFIRAQSKREKACVIIAEEHHKDGQEHIHVAIDFGSIWQTKNVRIFDYEDRHPNFKKILSLKHWVNVRVYLTKEDKEVKVDESIYKASKIWNCTSLAEAMIQDVDPLRAKVLWECRGREEKRVIRREKFAWYEDVDECIERGTFRKINWFCDNVGNTGKTRFCKWALRRPEKDMLAMKLVGRVLDFNFFIAKKLEEGGWTGKVLLLDLPRAMEDRDTIYEVLEIVLDGFGNSSKYNCPDFDLDTNPVVIVFANWWPRFKKSSVDRWSLFHVTSRDDRALEINIKEARALTRRWGGEQ